MSRNSPQTEYEKTYELFKVPTIYIIRPENDVSYRRTNKHTKIYFDER